MTIPGSCSALVVVALGAAACAVPPQPAWRTAVRGLPSELASADALWQELTLRDSPTGDVRDANLAVTVAMADERHVPAQHLRVGDGYLVGLDCGEWGGALWWVSADGAGHRKLADANVLAILGDANGATVVTGTSHLTISEGDLLHVRSDPGWRIAASTRLEECPHTVAVVPPDRLMLAGSFRVVWWDGHRLSPCDNLARP